MISLAVCAFQVVNPFSDVPVIALTDRIALTPVLDGKLEREEWDSLSGSTYLQWEPGKLHLAANVKNGSAAIFTIDLNADGWLVGKDNIEVTFRRNEGGVEVSSRLLDCTPTSGPTWTSADTVTLATSFTSNLGAEDWTVEATLQDPGLGWFPTKAGKKVGIRADIMEPGAVFEPYLPRTTAPINLVTERALSVPNGLKWSAEGAGRITTPGGAAKLRLTFNGTNDLGIRRVEMRSEGLAEQFTDLEARPFPEFDRKGRAYVDYATEVAKGATTGYRLCRAILTDSSGATHAIQASYAILPVLSFDMPLTVLKPSDKDQVQRLSVYLRSNTDGRLDGSFSVDAGKDLEVKSGNGKRFILGYARAAKRQVFELNIPANTSGSFPLTFKATFGDKVIEDTVWLRIGN